MPLRAAIALIASLMLNLAFSGWGNLSLLFVDLSHPEEYRINPLTIVITMAAALLIFATLLVLVLTFAQRLPRKWHLLAITLIFTAFWAQGELFLGAWMIPENGGETWAWHEPFIELFWHPALTPALFLTALGFVLWDAARSKVLGQAS
ncbi:MAG: hypothetical protein ACRC6I_19990 [Paracoccaceae bacterium]